VEVDILSNYHLIITALVPILVAVIAGVMRQNHWPNLVNEIISYGLVLVLSAANAYLDGKLVGASFFSSFLIIVAYAAASINSQPYQALQQWLQANIFSYGEKVSKPGPDGKPIIDQNALANLIASELQRNTPVIVALLGDAINKSLGRQVQAINSVIPARASAVTQTIVPVKPDTPQAAAFIRLVPNPAPSAAGTVAAPQDERGIPDATLGEANTPTPDKGE
jgi:hypothetical protein